MYLEEIGPNIEAALEKIARRTRRKVVTVVEETTMLGIVQARGESVHLDVGICIARTLSS